MSDAPTPAWPADESTPAWPADEPLQARIDHERAARQQAETLLNAKSRELLGALQHSRDAERRLQLALWASGEGIWEWCVEDGLLRTEGLLVDGQPMTVPLESLPAMLQRVHEDDREPLLLAWRLHANGSRDDIDTAYRMRLGGRDRWLRVRGRALQRDGQGQPLRVTGTVKDVTDQRDAEHSLHLMAQAFASTLDALVVADEHWRIVQANESFRVLAGAPQAPLGRALAEFIELPAQAAGGSGWQGEGRMRRGAAAALPVEASVTTVAEQAGQGRCYIVVLRDISARREAERKLEHLALHDSLTELPNRGALDAHLAARLEGAAVQPFALMFIDLDGFKAVNDSFGHRAGDELLCRVAERLGGTLGGAFVSRWGGDEFVVVMPPGSDEASLREGAQLVIASLSRPFGVDGHEVAVTPSIGGVCCPDHGADAQTLLRRADAAMYAAKDGGRNGLVIFHDALDQGVQRRTRLQSLLRADAERNAFHFVVQPKVDAQGANVGAEMLMRWTPEALGPVSPAEFIPIAEQIGMIDLMGRHALHAAARIAREAHALGSRATVAVNLSPRQLLHADLERIVMHACERNHADPRWLELELTESALVADVGLVERLLVRLRRHGFVLALDDFGTGYSSLSHLRQLPFHKVKIDRSFVKDVDRDPRSRLMLDGIVALCASLGLATVAEGVETREQFELLKQMQVSEFQGFLFARPQPQEQWFASLRAAAAAA